MLMVRHGNVPNGESQYLLKSVKSGLGVLATTGTSVRKVIVRYRKILTGVIL